jgi:relaxase-like protein/DNA relaxase TraI-like protein
MTGNANKGGGFGGLCRYLLQGEKDKPNPDRVAWTSTRELALEDPREAAILMRKTAALGRARKPVEHLSFSLAPGEHLSREQWEVLIDRTLKDLGLEGYQVLIVAHQDTKCEHVHLMINRVHPETYRAWDRWRDKCRVIDSMRLREPEFGLRVNLHVKDPDRLPDRAMKAFIYGGEPPLLDFARTEAREIFKEARSWDELHERLADKGLFLERKGQGLVVTDDHRYVKSSSVDRAASLKALEARLGPYQERQPVLQQVESDLRGDRLCELTEQVVPVHRARSELTETLRECNEAAFRLEQVLTNLRSAIQEAYRDPAGVEDRFFAHLKQQKAVPRLQFGELKELRGTVLHAGRTLIPLGAQGNKALDIALEQLPRLGVDYLRADQDLERAGVRLDEVRQKEAQLTERYRPQLLEVEQIRERLGDLYERVFTLRPRDQLALARMRGGHELEQAAWRAPDAAVRTLHLREQWIRNLPPDLDRALDRRFGRTGLSLPSEHQNRAAWAARALRLGLHPLHAVQVLTRGGVPLASAGEAVALAYQTIRNPGKTAGRVTAKSVQALTRGTVPLDDLVRAASLARSLWRHPLKTGVWLTAQAVGIPTLPIRLATMGWDLVKEHVLSQ